MTVFSGFSSFHRLIWSPIFLGATVDFISLFALNILIWALAWIVSTGILENNEILRLLAIALAMLLALALLSGPFVLLITLYLNGFGF